MGAPALFMLDTGPKTPLPSTPIFCPVSDARLLAYRLPFTLGKPPGDKHKRTRNKRTRKVSPYPHPRRAFLPGILRETKELAPRRGVLGDPEDQGAL